MTNSREQIVAATRAEFINALTNGDFEIEHKVLVHEALALGGHIDYLSGKEEFTLKSASLKRKKHPDGGFTYVLKIVVE